MSYEIWNTEKIRENTDLVKLQTELTTLADAHPERKYFHQDSGETDEKTGKPIFYGYEKRRFVKQ